ncbi:MAG: IscS subfamily cysteine desulfurase [Deltaproteobacteria bacterium]|nr:IscS subfamily cysteine desulfurase [Deltaproteobacteria bacterium]
MTVQTPIYMDHHATTPVHPQVLDAMLPYLKDDFGNAASRSHAFGWKAEAAVEHAREKVAALIGADPREILFTSGATESDNLAVKGAARYRKEAGTHLVVSAIEHKAVLDSAHALEAEGFEVTFLPVTQEGLVEVDAVRDALRPTTTLVSVMLANNEVGTVQPVAEIGALCRDRGVLFHTDAVQGLGRVPFDVATAHADLVSLSAHKMYGPKGIGALYVRRGRPRVRLEPLIHGGGHERGMRSGTLPVHQIVGFGAAAALAFEDLESGVEIARVRALRDRLWHGLSTRLTEVRLNGSRAHRLPNNLNVSFAFVEGEALMMAARDVAVSSGSACTSASLEPSYVLRAMGVPSEVAHSSIRFGLGRSNTEEEVDHVVDLFVEKVTQLREMSPLYEMARQGIDLGSVQWHA